MAKNARFADQPVFGVSDAAEIGEVIRQRRRELGYSQERFSSVVGMSPRLICAIEHGKESTSIQKIMDIIIALEIECIFAVRDHGLS
ncbi:MAG: helix-turn-helix domain-containing protein [Coriobacteriia bacterium]|nr:helix-turn-helix domain-containing protein [Coriobacteriia bacterium]